ncbi:MAG: hypothetical protein S4CHLAM20_10300 [Chlamydiia bacterium]|nr:hypothetical protein [Chlamydiia bacterium]
MTLSNSREKKRVAIIPGPSLHHGLMMMVASHRLLYEGAEVTTYHKSIRALHEWFPSHNIITPPENETIFEEFSNYDLIILQYDNTPFCKELIAHFRTTNKPLLSVFYPHYRKMTHPPLTPLDRVFNKSLPMVENISLAIASLLCVRQHSKNNGLLPPKELLHRKYKKRVAIYPSQNISKKYEKIKQTLEKLGFEPFYLDDECSAKGAELLYESGFFIGPDSDFCHLASNLQIPTLVVTKEKRPASIHTPGWLRSSFITPPKWIPRAQERLISVDKVMKGFYNLARINNIEV